jgi:GrpB-like predicted nucleotidyltransferase (UPF0157 family)
VQIPVPSSELRRADHPGTVRPLRSIPLRPQTPRPWTKAPTGVRGERRRAFAAWTTELIDLVGSTSIADLPAKPLIELQAPVAGIRDLESVTATLVRHGWHYVNPDLDLRPSRRFFVKVTDGRRSAHLHLVTTDGPRWNQQVAFRDALRADPALTADYATLKRALAAKYADNREAYSAAKSYFVRTVIERSA